MLIAMSNVDGKIIYEEKVRFPLIRGVVALFAVLTISFLIAYVYQRVTGQLGPNPVPLWFAATILSAMAFFTLFLANLVTLSIRMMEDGAVVGFGIFRVGVKWVDVRDCRPDRESSFLSAANWGVSVGFTGRTWRRMYNVMGCPRVVLEMRQGRRALVFSTKEPDKVVDIIKSRIQTQRAV
ncbi:MAG: hypothetical protein WC333_10720 [Dehalococcoidia bacterium]|jgi:hypothetical protein